MQWIGEDKRIINIFISQLMSQLKMLDSSKEHILFWFKITDNIILKFVLVLGWKEII